MYIECKTNRNALWWRTSKTDALSFRRHAWLFPPAATAPTRKNAYPYFNMGESGMPTAERSAAKEMRSHPVAHRAQPDTDHSITRMRSSAPPAEEERPLTEFEQRRLEDLKQAAWNAKLRADRRSKCERNVVPTPADLASDITE
jgi:hypothetical protein